MYISMYISINIYIYVYVYIGYIYMYVGCAIYRSGAVRKRRTIAGCARLMAQSTLPLRPFPLRPFPLNASAGRACLLLRDHHAHRDPAANSANPTAVGGGVLEGTHSGTGGTRRYSQWYRWYSKVLTVVTVVLEGTHSTRHRGGM